MSDIENAFETLSARIGESSTPTEWFEVTQDRINDFADVTMDHQWIHVDPERAKEVLELLQWNEGNSSGRGIGCVSWDGSVHLFVIEQGSGVKGIAIAHLV